MPKGRFFMTKHLHKKGFIRSVIITIVISISIAALIYHFASKAIISNVTEALTEIASLGSKAVGNELQGRLDVIETIATGNTIIDPEISMDIKFEKLRRDVHRRNLSMIAISDVSGNAITTDNQTPYVGDREYFKIALAGKKNISEPVISRADGNLVITFAVPIIYNDEITGILFSIENIETLSTIADSVVLGEYGSSYIVDGKGAIIAHKNREYVKEGLNPLKEWQDKSYDKSVYDFFIKVLESEKGGSQYVLDDSVTYAGYSKINGTDWSFVISAPKNQIFKSVDRIYNFIIAILILTLLTFTGAHIYTKYLKRTLEEEKAFVSTAIEAANLIVMNIDSQGNIYSFNKYAELILGYKTTDVVGKLKLQDLVCDDYEDKCIKLLDIIAKKDSIDNYELSLKGKNNDEFYIYWNLDILSGYRGSKFEIIGIDITKRVELEKALIENHDELISLYEELYASEETLRQQYDELLSNQKTIHKLAYFDTLTGLPNRASLKNLFDTHVKNSNIKSALLLLDLDNFKYVNDVLGHNAGDNLLIRVGERIKEILKQDSWTSRLGGDEYMILIRGFSDIKEISDYADKLLIAVESGFYIENTPINISFSMGIAIYPDHGTSFNELMKAADTAMNHAKETGRRKYVFYNHEMNEVFIKNMAIENNIKKGLNNNEFLLHYQPQLEISTGKVRGFEALLRWNSEEYGFIPAAEFIDVAESSGLILSLGKLALNEACDFIKHLQEMGYSHLKVAVNISILQLMQDNFVNMIMDTVKEKGLRPEYLELEITETILMEFVEQNMDKIRKLNDLGVSISLDDFGTGYSSLTYLRELPINILKIDKSFIDEVVTSKEKSILTSSIISFAHKLELKAVAEGVETKEQLDFLFSHKCDIAQGYFISRPVSKDEALDFLIKHS